MTIIYPECGLNFSSRDKLETHKQQMRAKEPAYKELQDTHENIRLARLRNR